MGKGLGCGAGESRGGSGLLRERGGHCPCRSPVPRHRPCARFSGRTGTAPAFHRENECHRAPPAPPALVSPAAAATEARGEGLALLAAGFTCGVSTFAGDDDGGW